MNPLYSLSNQGTNDSWNVIDKGRKTKKFSTVTIVAIPKRFRVVSFPDTIPIIVSKKNTAARTNMLRRRFFFCIRSAVIVFTRINLAQSTGFITSAINNEELNTTISVIGRYFIKLPINPGQKANGINAASVVAVEAIIGQATSPVPYFAASSAENPFCL